MIRIVIIDDHPIVRHGLQDLLREAGDFEVVAALGTGHEGLAKVRSHPVDVVALDIGLPDQNGFEVLRQIHAERPEVKVLMVSVHPEERFALRALQAGAAGYLAKTSVAEELVIALRRIAGGGRYITSEVAARLAEDLSQGKPARLPHERLSPREFEVFLAIAGGLTVGEIAARMHLSVKTVSTHRAHIIEKMALRTNADLMRYAMENQLVA
ncbi:MAG: response regulator transcription factor [Candidatus Marinimicrobia bacterium]|nr:response regulator transcription factor [Candidatus Neomarinimicrobiota bacterium]